MRTLNINFFEKSFRKRIATPKPISPSVTIPFLQRSLDYLDDRSSGTLSTANTNTTVLMGDQLDQDSAPFPPVRLRIPFSTFVAVNETFPNEAN